MTNEEETKLRKVVEEVEDHATMISEITLTFRAFVAATPGGKKNGVFITKDMMEKMMDGALKALDPDADLSGNNISEIQSERIKFEAIQTGRALKQKVRKRLAELAPPAAPTKGKLPPKKGTKKKPAMKSARRRKS